MTDFTRLKTDRIVTFEIVSSEEQKLGELLYIVDALREKVQARKYDDNLLLSSTIAERIFSKLVTDNTFLKEDAAKKLDITRIDTVLINSIFTDLIELIAQDELLLKDDRFTEVEKNFLAFLLVGEALVKEFGIKEIDTVLLDDTTEQLALLFKEAVDGLFLTELIEATRSAQLLDTFLLVDETVLLVIRQVGLLLRFAVLDTEDFLGIQAFAEEDFLGSDKLSPFNVQFLQITLGARVASFFEHFENDFD